MMLYVIKAAITLALLYSCFFIFLSKETFHRFNRCMLVGIMLVSLVMPMFHFTTSHPTTLNEEVYIVQNYIEHDTTPIIVTAQQAQGITWIQALTWIYMAGVVLMLILTLVQAISLCRFMCSGVRHTDTKGNTVILHNNDVPPFSIFRYIVMSVKDYESSRQYILTHEQEHIRLGHTYDLLLLQGMHQPRHRCKIISTTSRDEGGRESTAAFHQQSESRLTQKTYRYDVPETLQPMAHAQSTLRHPRGGIDYQYLRHTY